MPKNMNSKRKKLARKPKLDAVATVGNPPAPQTALDSHTIHVPPVPKENSEAVKKALEQNPALSSDQAV